MSKCTSNKNKHHPCLEKKKQQQQQEQQTIPLIEHAQLPLHTMTVEEPGSVASRPTNALLVANDCNGHVHLIIGSNSVAGARCTRSLEAGARPIVIAGCTEILHHGVQRRVDSGQAEWIQRQFQDEDLRMLGRDEVDGYVDAVFVTSTADGEQCGRISRLCRRLRIPVNVTDSPLLCSFTLLSTYNDGPLQIGITTSGRGCKLASRIRREIVSTLPLNLGTACDRLGSLRHKIWEEDLRDQVWPENEDDDGTDQKSTFNALVTAEENKSRRIRWLSQICEYWPLGKLCELSQDDVDTIFESYLADKAVAAYPTADRIKGRGRIALIGAGPGHPDLLTAASVKAIQSADLVLADKLVPAPVLDLVPRRTEIYIARKFPGNAEKAQEELLSMGLAGLQKGLSVVRLKQGDPYIYGRGAEEYAFFHERGYTPVVLPGITSALSAPLFADIPATHRAVSDQVLICTGTGRKGAAPDPPEYKVNQTVVFLMALHRLNALVESLVVEKQWPDNIPCAIIERASCPDQRVIRSTLKHVCEAVEELGSRPPGLLVVGWSCEVLRSSKEKWLLEEGYAGF